MSSRIGHCIEREKAFISFCPLSLLAGNIYVFIALKTQTIDRATRIPLFTVFSIVSVVGLALFALIIWRSILEKRRQPAAETVTVKTSVWQDISSTLKTAGRLLKTRNMLLLLIPFAYSGRSFHEPINTESETNCFFLGFSQTFFQGVYGTCIGHYMKYGG